MTRLAAVLAGALEHIDRVGMHLDNHEAAAQLVAAIPEPEREALEQALDVCRVCGWEENVHYHNCAVTDGIHPDCHPYQPLVPLGDAS